MDLTHLLLFRNSTLENKYFYLLESLKRPDYHKLVEPKFSFDPKSLDESTCLRYFKFKEDDLFRLRDTLKLPEKMRCKNGLCFTGIEGLCILLRRLSYPNRYYDISHIFNRKEPDLSRIVSKMLDYVYVNFKCLVTNLHHDWMKEEALTEYTAAIASNGAPLNNCIGFIDGTLRPTCRPKTSLREVYSGHKIVHGIKFQSVVVPTGLIVNLHGPELARRHDSYMLTRSSLLEKLAAFPNYCVFGDQGCPIRPQLMVAYRGNLTQEKKEFNRSMSSLQIAVEWEFGRMVSLFAFLDFKKNLKIFMQPVAKLYIVGVILKNCHTCLYGSQSSKYFHVSPPSLEDYLENALN